MVSMIGSGVSVAYSLFVPRAFRESSPRRCRG